MRAFALYSFSDGFVRLNVRGREGRGGVAPGDYDRACAEVSELVRGLTDDRGGPVVEEVLRLRRAPDHGPNDHPADLVVRWAGHARDRFVHPRYGALGPVPVRRTGGHVADGFLCAAGDGVPAGIRLRPGEPLDVAPTVLALMGQSSSSPLPGRALLRPAARPAAA
jgi:predicted AlkP superfamily phosphohydrolase/phosphomutase